MNSKPKELFSPARDGTTLNSKQSDELLQAALSFLFWFNLDGEPVDGFRFREEEAKLRKIAQQFCPHKFVSSSGHCPNCHKKVGKAMRDEKIQEAVDKNKKILDSLKPPHEMTPEKLIKKFGKEAIEELEDIVLIECWGDYYNLTAMASIFPVPPAPHKVEEDTFWRREKWLLPNDVVLEKVTDRNYRKLKDVGVNSSPRYNFYSNTHRQLAVPDDVFYLILKSHDA